jgi:hypothetical protein
MKYSSLDVATVHVVVEPVMVNAATVLVIFNVDGRKGGKRRDVADSVLSNRASHIHGTISNINTRLRISSGMMSRTIARLTKERRSKLARVTRIDGSWSSTKCGIKAIESLGVEARGSSSAFCDAAWHGNANLVSSNWLQISVRTIKLSWRKASQ